MRTAVFGGTFDPPHIGHIKLAHAVLERGYADRILFIPAYRPPHKTDRKIASYEDRLNMLNIALKDFKEAAISDIERRRPDVLSYTFDTMTLLSAENPEDKFLLLIGEDSLAQLHTWHRAQELAANWKLLTYPRPGEHVTAEQLSSNWPEQLAVKLAASVVDLPFYDVSSTEIREKLSQEDNITGMVDNAVIKYIEEKFLYR